jgi:predicted 3-demethylubiquinone-9 3-methyltransferase (glyoxalase superfamily)
MGQTVTPFLMFEGKAEEAINFYISVLENSKVLSIQRYGPGEAGAEGSVMKAVFSLAGQTIMCIDSPAKHDFTFTPSISLFVDCKEEREVEELFGKLSVGGKVLMPLNNYGFSQQFGWVADRFGVSWQINLP